MLKKKNPTKGKQRSRCPVKSLPFPSANRASRMPGILEIPPAHVRNSSRAPLPVRLTRSVRGRVFTYFLQNSREFRGKMFLRVNSRPRTSVEIPGPRRHCILCISHLNRRYLTQILVGRLPRSGVITNPVHKWLQEAADLNRTTTRLYRGYDASCSRKHIKSVRR